MNAITFWSRARQGTGRLLCAIIFLLPLGYMLLSFGIFYFLTHHDYVSILDWYERRFPDAFDRGAVMVQSFTPDWYKWVLAHKGAAYVLLGAMPLVYLVFSRRVWGFSVLVIKETGRALRFLGRGLSGCSSAEKTGFLLLMAAVLAYRLYFYFSFPLHTDELCSYLFFVRPGFFISTTSYPLPNNHVFFNACCALVNLIPGLSPRAVMRLPSMAGDLFLLYSIFCLIRRWDGYSRAMVTVAGVAFCYLTSYYAVQGRGYQWQIACVLVSALSCRDCFWGPGRGERRGYALFILSSVIGFYINPVFLYHFTALGLVCCYYFMKERAYRDFLFFCRCVGVIVGVLVVLYLPLILASSWRALTANDYVTGMNSYKKLFMHFRDFAYVLKDMTYYGVPGLCFMLVCAIGLFIAYRKKIFGGIFYDTILVYLVALTVSLVFWILYKRLYPVERSLCFWPLVLNLVFVNGCYDLYRSFFVRGPFWPVVFFLLVKIMGSVRGVFWERWGIGSHPEVQISWMVEKDIRELGKLHPTSWQITDSDDFYSMYLQEYLIREGGNSRLVFCGTGVLGDVIFLPDSHPLVLPAGGYVLWGDKKITSHGSVLRIYVLSGLAGKNKNF